MNMERFKTEPVITNTNYHTHVTLVQSQILFGTFSFTITRLLYNLSLPMFKPLNIRLVPNQIKCLHYTCMHIDIILPFYKQYTKYNINCIIHYS